MKQIKTVIYTDGSSDTIEDYQEKQSREWKYLQKKKSDEETHKFIDGNFGSFYFNNYNKLLAKNLNNQMLFRFVYLCTFMNYENQLIFGTSKNIMVEKDLQEVLKLSERETRNTKNELIKAKLLLSKDKELSINKTFCSKGEIKIYTEVGAIRMFEDGIKKLYENVAPKDHKKLGVLVKILPYVNKDLNVLCHNPNCESADEVEILSLEEICEITGYNKPQDLKRNLMNITVNDIPIVMQTETCYQKSLVINPSIYYKGNKIEEMSALIKLFKLNSKKKKKSKN